MTSPATHGTLDDMAKNTGNLTPKQRESLLTEEEAHAVLVAAVKSAPSQRAWCLEHGVDPPYLSRVLSRSKWSSLGSHGAFVKAAGLRCRIMYEKIK